MNSQFTGSRFIQSPLIVGGGIVKAVSAAVTISFIDSSNADDPDITLPSSIDSGDLLILAQVSNNTPTAATPSGWTSFANYAPTGTWRHMLAYKIADGTEDSSTVTGMSDGKNNYKICLQFRASSPIATVTINDLATTGTAGNPGAQTCNASGGSTPLIVLGHYGSSDAIDPRTFSPAADGEIAGAATNQYAKYKIYNSSPADVTIDMDDEGSSNGIESYYVTITT